MVDLVHSRCLDLNGSQVSGGTNPNKELKERKVIIKYENCGDYKPTTKISGCASEDE